MATGKGLEPVYMSMTGAEFLQLIEQFTHDGKIDTLPELFEFLKSVPDDMSLEDYIKEYAADPETIEKVVDSTIEEQQAQDVDIDEIFPEQNEI